MTQIQKRIAKVFPADAQELADTQVENTRLNAIAQSLASAGVEVVSAPFCDEIAGEIEAAHPA